MLLILVGWRKTESFTKFSTASNVGLMIAGTLLFLMQMHGYSHEVFVDEYAFSKVSHYDEHINMTTENDSVEGDSTGTPKGLWKDSVTIIIPAGKSKEYKFHVLKDALLEYSWTTNGGKLFFDFHGEPKGDTTGYFKSYKKSTESESSGSFTAPFEGSHGWYWKNKGLETVEVTLKTKGSYKILGIR